VKRFYCIGYDSFLKIFLGSFAFGLDGRKLRVWARRRRVNADEELSFEVMLEFLCFGLGRTHLEKILFNLERFFC